MDVSDPVQPPLPKSRGPVNAVLRDTGKMSWSDFAGPRGLRCLPAIIAPLVYGIVYDKPVPALLAAAGAMSVGFGSFQKLYQSRLAPMVLASISMAASAFVGTQLGHSKIGLVIAACVWGFVCGISASVGPGATYIGTQSIIFLLVASAFPTPPREALPLVSLVQGAGLLQALIILLCRLVAQRNVIGHSPKKRTVRVGPIRGIRLACYTVRRSTIHRRVAFWHGVRLAVMMAVSTGLSRLSPDPHNYWMPMTTAIILQQDFHQTITKALSRVGGTLVGAAIATLIAAVLRPEHWALVILIIAFAWLAYSLLKVNYFVFAACITAYIVFLLSFAGLPELSVIKTRAIFTTLGAVVALLPYAFQKRHRVH